MTKQQAFDKMVAHLAQQKCAAVDIFGICVYRGPFGTKCVVGALISDQLVVKVMSNANSSKGIDQNDVWALCREELSLEDVGDKEAQGFYLSMQQVHDGCLQGPVEHLRERLHSVAERYELDPALVATITRWWVLKEVERNSPG